MHDLEKYILEHRDELDQVEAVPAEAMWQRIAAARPVQAQHPSRARLNWQLLAAVALVLALAGWGLLRSKKTDPAATVPTPPTPKEQVPVAQLPPQPKVGSPAAGQATEPPLPALAEKTPKPKRPVVKQPTTAKQLQLEAEQQPAISAEEQRLQQLVVQKQREIGLDTLDRETYAGLLRELDELEISVQEARRDLQGGPERDRLVETLIRYYELKIRILEQINYEINKKEYHESLEKRI